MSHKLYSPQSLVSAGCKVEVLLRFFDFQVEFERIPSSQWKSAEYLKKHPMGKVPTLETPEGCIFESHTIMRYFARKAGQMYGSNAAQTASIDQWLEFINTQLYPSFAPIIYAVFGYFPVSKQQYDNARKEVWECLRMVDAWLKDNKFLAGNSISIADVSLAVLLRYPFRLIFDEKNRKGLPNLTRWFEETSNLQQFKDHFGKLWLCQKEFVPEFVGGNEAPKAANQEKPKAEKKKKQQPKKKEQPKKKQKPAVEEEQEAPKKKTTNPLDELPKSAFNLEDFKREICNAGPENERAVLQKLFDNFDTEGWSVWRVHYIKYEGEGIVGYLTNNLKNGHLRNIEHFKKYSFAMHGVYGVEGNYEIDGVWMWRGTEIPNEWKDSPSYDYFTFNKLNPKDEADQKLIVEYWLNRNEGQKVEGKDVFDAVWFH